MAIRNQILDKKVDMLLDSISADEQSSIDDEMISAAYVNQYFNICTDAQSLAKSGDTVIPRIVECWPSLTGLRVLFALIVFENVKNHSTIPLILEKTTVGGQLIQQHALKALAAIASSSVRSHVEELTRNNNHVIRQEAVNCIAAIGASESLPVLHECLNDEEPDVRLAVVKALKSVDDPSIIQLLFGALADPQMGVAFHAKQHLKKLAKTQDFTSYLIEGLDRKGRYTRDYIIELMGAVKDKIYIRPLIDHYEICDNKKRRELILKTLAKYKDKQILLVLALAVADKESDLQEYALKLVKRFKWPECIPLLIDCAVILARRSEESYLPYPLDEVYTEAVSSIKDKQAEELLKILSKHIDSGIQEKSCAILMQREVAVTDADIQELLNNKYFAELSSNVNLDIESKESDRSPKPNEKLSEETPREKIEQAPFASEIDNMSDQEVIACAADCFGRNVIDPQNLINRLARIGGAKAILLIRSQLKHKNIIVRAETVNTLLRLGVSDLTDKDLVLTVLCNVKHLQHKIREFGQTGIDATVEYLSFPVSGSYGVDLLQILDDSNHPMRFDIFAKLLGNPSDKTVIKALHTIVKKSKKEIEPLLISDINNFDSTRQWGISHTFECIYFAGIYKSKETVDKLIELIQSKKKMAYIRVCAEALGRIKDKRAVAPLIDAVKWAEEGPPLNAVMASLVKFKAKESIDALKEREIKRPTVAKKRDECVVKLKGV